MTFPIAQKPAPHAPRPWIKRSLLGLLLLALAVGLLIVMTRVSAPPAPSGTLADVGGYKLHLFCQGTATGPTVILDAGNGETSLTWALVQPEVAGFARVCTYDRAGYAWSEASPKPRTIPVMVEEFHALLKGANIQGPVVLVGHSIGGIVARHYAAQYPGDVSGVVLVDSAHEEQFQRFPKSVVDATKAGLEQLKTLEKLVGLGFSGLASRFVPLETRLPPTIAETLRSFMVADTRQVAATRGEIEELMKGTTSPVATLGALPLVVVSRGKAEMDQETERIWTTLQLELAALSTNSRRIIATGSKHGIQLDEPQVVVEAIRQVWSAQR